MNFSLQGGNDISEDPQFNDPDRSRNDMGAFGGPSAPDFTTGIRKENIHITDKVALFQNIPNPFTEQTDIRFEIARDEWISLTVYNIVGQKVRV
jgi:hypothetical protein